MQSMEGSDPGADRYTGLMLQNDENDGIWVVLYRKLNSELSSAPGDRTAPMEAIFRECIV